MKNQIFILKSIEILIFINTFFIISYDFILPKKISNDIYDFGIEKVAIFTLFPLLAFYFIIGLKEKDYIKAKFSNKKIIVGLIGTLVCVILYFIMMYKSQDMLDSFK